MGSPPDPYAVYGLYTRRRAYYHAGPDYGGVGDGFRDSKRLKGNLTCSVAYRLAERLEAAALKEAERRESGE